MKKKLVYNMMVVVIAMVGVAQAQVSDPNAFAVGNPNSSNGWSTIDAVIATSSGFQFTLEAIHAINGSGLDAGTGTMHNRGLFDFFWSGPAGGGASTLHPGTVAPTLNWIAFEFDQAYPLTNMHVWNYNYNTLFNTGSGAKDVVVEYSLTGSSDPAEWTNLGAFRVDQGTALDDFVGNEVCNFRGNLAKYVTISIITDWGSPFGDQGLAEVRFYFTDDPDNYVPPPGFDLTMAASPGFVTTITPMAGTFEIDAGAVQSISADPYIACPDTWAFSHWTGDGINDLNSAETTVHMLADRVVTAHYVLDNECGDICHPNPLSDLDDDCIVGVGDLAIMATQWMECTQVVCL